MSFSGLPKLLNWEFLRHLSRRELGGVKSMRILIFLLCLCASAAAQAQTLKPGDTLSVSVMQDSKLDRTVVIDPSGQIAFPLAGHFRVSGLTPQAVENILKDKLRNN